MAERTLKDFTEPTYGSTTSITCPDIGPTSFEQKTNLAQFMQQDQFSGSLSENPNDHLDSFLEKCDMIKILNVTSDAIRLRLFGFSLRDKAKEWVKSHSPNTFTTWDALSRAFLIHFFPPAKAAELRGDITTFIQRGSELLGIYLQRNCPHHGVPEWLIIQTFRNGLKQDVRTSIDAVASGSIVNKTPAATKALIEDMASNNYLYPTERSTSRKRGKLDVDALTLLSRKFDSFSTNISKKINSIGTRQATHEVSALSCDMCGNQGHSVDNYDGDTNLPDQSANGFTFEARNQLPPQPVQNPRGQMTAVTLRSGRPLVEKRKSGDNLDATLKEKKAKVPKGMSEIPSKYHAKKVSNSSPIPQARTSVIPYPERLVKDSLEIKFRKFMDMLKQFQVTIPFLDALFDIPSYAKFQKDLLSLKNRVTLSKECSALITNTLPEKMQDPRSFSIPCSIGGLTIQRALCDLGASVSLMPLTVARKVHLGDLKATNVSLQLTDRFIKYPVGMLEDLLLQVGNLIIPCDFVIMAMTEDAIIPIILGHPFLATAGAMIDVKNGRLLLNVGKETIEFELRKGDEKTDDDLKSIAKVFDESDHYTKKTKVEPIVLSQEEGAGHASPPKVDLKHLPPYLKYVFLGSDNTRNPNMKEVVQKEVMKLLKAGIIYHISNSAWVSPVQLVPKKGEIPVVKNDKDELISTRTVTGWRMCIDYRKLNLVT
ncbi:hypothetical protein OSB04_007580 [Centaurea solstitialis]|uniref:Retrotransposon gag domain-containing protein n=1 Tax=Centaurea solstitialis TaxID=347529 RepID=A0AA38TWS7_9ASTR|nr:hypothetical protein OSB04_007580 [Centaurea solstitialis]